MKYLVAVLAVACGAAGADPATPARKAPDLRQAVRQYHPGTVPAAPRQLSPTERALLRKQLGAITLPRPASFFPKQERKR
jgi:hypothetical protein